MGIPFDTKELEAVGVLHMKTAVLQQDVKVYDFPVSKKEGFLAPYRKKPIWIPYGVEKQFVVPRMIPDNVACGVAGDIPLKPEEKGGPDMFGIEWEFIPAAGGSMVRPGAPLLNDISEWRQKVKFPDIDSWDWEGSSKSWAKVHDPSKGYFFTLHNGFWFERLISFMGFENAVLALFDEDTQDEVNALFEETTKLACKIVDKVVAYYNVDGFYVHDDWGTNATCCNRLHCLGRCNHRNCNQSVSAYFGWYRNSSDPFGCRSGSCRDCLFRFGKQNNSADCWRPGPGRCLLPYRADGSSVFQTFALHSKV